MQKIAGTRSGVLSLLLLPLLGLASCASLAVPRQATEPRLEDYGIAYSLIARGSPRPLRVHLVVADLKTSRLRLSAPVPRPAPRPGTWEARLDEPMREARSLGSLVLVNASAFSILGCPQDRSPLAYLPGQRADIAGLAIHEGRVLSPPRSGFAALFVDGEGTIAAGYGPPSPDCVEAAAGFALLVDGGASLAGSGGSLAARTAIGADARGRLLIAVVEGGRRGRSEGLSLAELADLMIEEGAVWAINMDGGGSSFMVLRRGGREFLVSEGEEHILGIPLPERPLPNFIALLPGPP
jgi:hypothetical protein